MIIDKIQPPTRQITIEKNVSKLRQQNQQLQEDAIEELSILFQNLNSTENQVLESAVLQIADVFIESSN